jgi:protein-S-isoprenylcysteine O-methyltransferase Ste14
VHVIGEFNDDSAADEEFALAFAASAAVALAASLWAASLAIRRRVSAWWPAGSWILGFGDGALFLAFYLLWVAGRQVEG